MSQQLLNKKHKAMADHLLASNFLASPSQEIKNALISKFIDATANKALRNVACGSCARETSILECDEIPLKNIPNKHHLIPHMAHAAHELVDGLLFFTPGLGLSKATVYLCHECRNQLKLNKKPRLSLSNGMWIGNIPPQLDNLNLPERLLLAKYFPLAFIVKLFPKHKNAHSWNRNQMHSALRGNVSTYRLDPRQVASMIDGTMFPRPVKILSAMIGITFVGPKGLPESTMPAMFKVRRWRVRDALSWLKANNPLYSDIEISEERLLELPEDGIPDEIMLTAKHSTNIEAVEREHEGYVPADAAEDVEGTMKSSKQSAPKLTRLLVEIRHRLSEAGLIEIDDDGEVEHAGMTKTTGFHLPNTDRHDPCRTCHPSHSLNGGG